MVLTKESIDAIRLTRKFGKCYDAREVDILLDEIAAAAEEQCREIEQLRSTQSESIKVKDQILESLLSAQKVAADLIEQTKRECAQEKAVLLQTKTLLQNEISSLEQYKILTLNRIRNELEKLMGDSEYVEIPPQYDADEFETDCSGILFEEQTDCMEEGEG